VIVSLAVVAILSLGVLGLRWLHTPSKPAPIEHTVSCPDKLENKPDCKCETLEAGKVIIK